MPKIKDGTLITNKDDIDYILSLEEKDLTISLIIELLGKFNNKRRFEPFDYIKIPPNSYGPSNKRNKNEFTTTIGLWIFNRLCIENELFSLFGYINEPIHGKKFESLRTDIGYAVLEDDIPVDTLKHFLLKSQLLMRLTTVLAAHYDDKILMLSDTIKPLKKKLIAQYKDRLDAGDEVAAEEIEKQLIEKTKEILGDDDAMEIFDSGARGNIPNNLKNLCLLKGAVYNSVSGKYDIATSCYMDGISKEDYHIFANSIAPGSTARSLKTQNGGYMEKLLFSGFQHIKMDKPDSDCGTKRYVEVYLTKDNISDWMYSYILDKGNLVELNSKTKSKYINKYVKIRFAAFCESKNNMICEHCAGTLFRKLGMENIGMLMPKLGSTVKQKCLKLFHNSTVQTIDAGNFLDKIFSMPEKKIKIE